MRAILVAIAALLLASGARGFAPFAASRGKSFVARRHECASCMPRFGSNDAGHPWQLDNGSSVAELASSSSARLRMGSSNDNVANEALSVSAQTLLGATGTLMALVTLYSEYTLKTTGCGLPAGPGGLIGAVEGVIYLGTVGIAGYSLFTKVKTGSGLPAGPAGLLGAAEGLSFLAIVAGLLVLAFQVVNYGYIPNAVPMEGGMCS